MNDINWDLPQEQGSLFVNSQDWSNLLEEDANRPQSERKEVTDGTHTVEIKKVELKPANDKFPAQISVQVYFPEFNSTHFDNLPTDDSNDMLWRTRVFLSTAAKASGLDWRDSSKHKEIFDRATGASGEVEFSWSAGKNDKKYPRFKWLRIDATAF